MKIVQSIEEYSSEFRHAVLTLGNFDGLHRGHQLLFHKVSKIAQQRNLTSVALTFQPHPLKILQPSVSTPQITPLSFKIDLIEQMGVDILIIQPFSHKFAAFSASYFLEKLLLPSVKPDVIIVGQNFSFGKGKEGNATFLKQQGLKHGFEVEAVIPVKEEDIIISSSVIRKLVINGELCKTEKMLGRPYLIRGRVYHGDHRGKELGFPTANINTKHELLPPNGVYAATIPLFGELKNAVVNIGYRPTFNKKEKTIEAHILNFNKTLYNKDISLHLLKKIRNEKRFDEVEQLIKQINYDILDARNYFSSRKNLKPASILSC